MKMIFVFIFLMFSQLSFGNQFQVNDIGLIGGGGGNSTYAAPQILTLPESALLLGGSAVGTADKGWFHLYAGSLGGGQTTDNVQPFYKNGVLYQVPTGSTAHVIQVCGIASATADYFQLIWDTVTFATNATVGSLTAPKYEGGATTRYQHVSSQTVNLPTCTSAFFNFPTATWPGAQVGGAGATQVVQVLVHETTP